MDSIAVFQSKPAQLPAPQRRTIVGEEGQLGLTFDLELEHRVWLAKFRVDRRDRGGTDPARLDWDAYETGLCLPEAWGPSWLATEAQFGGRWQIGELTSADGSHPTIGDRVVAYRTGSKGDVVGVWLITGVTHGPNGAVRYSHRPLVSCLEPVALRPEVRFDADLARIWDDVFGRCSRSLGSFFPLAGQALSAVMRTVGIDPQLLCGPTHLLPDCSMSNVRPDRTFRPQTYLSTELNAEAVIERRAVDEAVDWMLSGWSAQPAPEADEATPMALVDVEVAKLGGEGGWLVGRAPDHVVEVVAVGVESSDLSELSLCPTLVMEAAEAVDTGRDWSLVVTLDALGAGRTVRFDALAVVVCFDPASGRVNLAGS